MNIEQLLKLIEAGYTKAEIEAMTSASPEDTSNKPEDDEAGNEEDTPEDNTEPSNEPEDETANQFLTLSQELENIKKMIQKSNIINKGNDEKPKTETASDILAKLIDPKLNGGN